MNILIINLWFLSTVILWPFQVTILNFSIPIFPLLISLVIIFKLRINRGLLNRCHLINLILLIFLGVQIISYCKGSFFLKSFGTFFLLSFYVYVSGFVVSNIGFFNWKKIEKVCFYSCLIIFISVVITIFDNDFFGGAPRSTIYTSYSGLYNEPSHLGISIVSPLLICIFADRTFYRYFGLFLLIFFLLFSFSSTFLILMIVSIFIIIYTKSNISLVKKLNYIFYAMLMSVLIFVLLNYFDLYSEYFNAVKSRFVAILNYISNNEYLPNNLSSRVYMAGWINSFQDLFHTYGLGLGINARGCHNNYFTPLLEDNFINLNIHNGSFIFSKLLSEFGLFSFYLIYLFLSRFNFMNNSNKVYLRFKNELNPYLIIYIVIFVSFFIRSTNYFSNIFFITVFLYSYQYSNYAKR